MAQTFAELDFGAHPNWADGKQARATYPNGYGVSVVQSRYSYGGPEGLYELAVIGPDGNLCYDTPITADVEGHLTEADVTRLLGEVAALPTQVSA